MTEAITAQGYWGPDPEDRDNEFIQLADRTFLGRRVVEPFADGFDGQIEPIDFEMRGQLRRAVAEGVFMNDQFPIPKALGAMMLQRNPDTVRWN